MSTGTTDDAAPSADIVAADMSEHPIQPQPLEHSPAGSNSNADPAKASTSEDQPATTAAATSDDAAASSAGATASSSPAETAAPAPLAMDSAVAALSAPVPQIAQAAVDVHGQTEQDNTSTEEVAVASTSVAPAATSASAPSTTAANTKVSEPQVAPMEVDANGAMLNAATIHAQQILLAATAALAHVSNTPVTAPAEEPAVQMEDVQLNEGIGAPTTVESPVVVAHKNDAVSAPPATPATASYDSATAPPAGGTSTQPPEKSLSKAMARSIPVSNGDGDITRCPCGDNKDQEGFMIQCESCEIWQHGSCVGLTEKTTPEQYYCELCDAENPIHQLFRRTWGDRTPVKGRAHKQKLSKRKGEDPSSNDRSKDASNSATGAGQNAAATPRPNPKDKRQRLAAAAAAAAIGGKPLEPAVGAANAALAPGTNKRKRTVEEQTATGATGAGGPGATPKSRGGRKGDDLSGASPDLNAKKPRLEDSLAAQAAAAKAQEGAGQVSAPATPATHRGQSYSAADYDFPSTPLSSSTPHSSLVTSDLAALAAELGGSTEAGEMTPAGSREARKIQRYIQMIQKMETGSAGGVAPAGAPANGKKLDRMDEEGADDMAEEDAGEDGTPQPPSTHAVDLQLQQAYGAAAAARMARARLRSEKLERQESQQGDEPAGEQTLGADKTNTQSSKDARKKKQKVVARKEEVPALTAQEIRKLRLTASSQLRPLGPMYFGRKQFLLQSYRDDALRCETGWAAVIHEEVPLVKRVLHQYRLAQKEAASPQSAPASHHHHHAHHPSTIFPASHPWSIPHVRTSKSLRARQRDQQQQQEEEEKHRQREADHQREDAHEENHKAEWKKEMQPDEEGAKDDEEDGARPMEVDGDNQPLSPHVKTESNGALPHPEEFFASIDTSSLPSRVQQLISSFQSSPPAPKLSAPRADPPYADLAATVPLEYRADHIEEATRMDESEDQTAPSSSTGVLPVHTEILQTTTTTTTYIDSSEQSQVKVEQVTTVVKTEEVVSEQAQVAQDAEYVPELEAAPAPVVDKLDVPKASETTAESEKGDVAEVHPAAMEIDPAMTSVSEMDTIEP